MDDLAEILWVTDTGGSAEEDKSSVWKTKNWAWKQRLASFLSIFMHFYLVKFYGNSKFSTVLQKEDGLFVDASGRLWIQHS